MKTGNARHSVKIKSAYWRMKSIRSQITSVSFFSDKHKKTREWLVLGAVQELLLKGGADAPVLAQEHEAPDFRTFNDDGSPWADIEIVEVLRPGYRRHKFYKTTGSLGAVPYEKTQPLLPDPWKPMREVLRRKVTKNYGSEVCLVVYFDIGRMSFEDLDTPFDKQLVREHAQEPFRDLDAFKRVLILSSDLASLVELSPAVTTIVPDEFCC